MRLLLPDNVVQVSLLDMTQHRPLLGPQRVALRVREGVCERRGVEVRRQGIALRCGDVEGGLRDARVDRLQVRKGGLLLNDLEHNGEEPALSNFKMDVPMASLLVGQEVAQVEVGALGQEAASVPFALQMHDGGTAHLV